MIPTPSRRQLLATGLAGGAAALAGSALGAQPGAVPLPPVSDPADDAARLAFADGLVGGGRKTVRRSLTIRGAGIDYDTILGAIALPDDSDRPGATFVYTAYVRAGISRSGRPVTFAWGGGPSGPSTSFHFSSLGPRLRTEGADARFVDNPLSLLDRSDLVMVDPVGTGWSMPAAGRDYGDFYSVVKDARAVTRFIRSWLDETGRQSAPLYLIGRSYGTVRMPSVVHYLREANVRVKGAIAVAPAMDGNAFWESSGNMASFYLMLPNYCAIAWYHDRQARRAATVQAALQEGIEFALGDYLVALLNWPTLDAGRREAVLDRLHALTGIGRQVWAERRLRLNGRLFVSEFLRDRNRVLQWSDGRVARPAPAAPAAPPAPPQESFINAYVRDELGVAGAPPYRGLAPGLAGAQRTWPVDRRGLYELGAFKVSCLPNFLDDVAEAMIADPEMRFQHHAGIYDLQSTSFPGDWSVANMNLPDALRRNVETFDYESGHPIYDSAPQLERFMRNLAGLYA